MRLSFAYLQENMMLDVCIIDYFTPEFINHYYTHQILTISNVVPIQAKGHGQAIVQIVRAVNPRVKWGFVNIGANTLVGELIDILNYLVDKNVAKIINISFGYYSISDLDKRRLESIISLYQQNNIHIICAVDNYNRPSYPAILPGVLSVQGIDSVDLNTHGYAIHKNSISVRKMSLLVKWTQSRKMWVYGNSYYTGIVSGIFSLNIKDYYPLGIQQEAIGDILLDNHNLKSYIETKERNK